MKFSNRRIFIIIFFVSFSLLTFSCKKTGETKIRIDRIFLIIIDTLRADHLGCYGYPRNTSPFMDSLAKKGVLFEKAYSQSASTSPSHASIFTGLYPFQHRVLANGYVLDDSYTTLAEILSQNGFKTAAFVSTDRHFHVTKINQGFQFYEDPVGTQEIIGKVYRSARLTKNNAAIWLDNFNPNQKLFLWLHLFDPHIPYRPLKMYLQNIKDSLSRKDFFRYMRNIPTDLEVFENKSNKMFKKIIRYDAEIRYVDEELRNFFQFIEHKGLNENALWIITSDHGEGLGQHKWYIHGKLLYQEQIHVPLIFYFPNKKVSPKRIDDIVENFDIFSTIIEALGITIDRKLKEEVKSISLWGKITENNPEIQKKHSFSERRFFKTNLKKMYPEIPAWQLNWEEGEKYCLQNKNFKYIFRTKLPDEFYDLVKDPFELNNVIDKKEYERHNISLKKELFKILNEIKKYKNKKQKTVDKKELSKLRSLGYIL